MRMSAWARTAHDGRGALVLHGMKDASPEALLLFECFCFRANYAACLAAPRGDRLDGAPKEELL